VGKKKLVQNCQHRGISWEPGRAMKEYHPNCRKRVYYHANKERLNAERIRKKQDSEAARQQANKYDEKMGYVDSP